MKLLRFCVTNFRSVRDSGWIETDDVTALIGTNESGKTNILVPLWKLNPAKEGDIDLTADYPRKRFNEFRSLDPQPIFIQAAFDVGDELAEKLSALTGLPASQLLETIVSRRFDGEHIVDFPNAKPARTVEKKRAVDLISLAETELTSLSTLKGDEALKPEMLKAVGSAKTILTDATDIGATQIKEILALLKAVKLDDVPKSSTIVPRYQRISEEVTGLKEEISHTHPKDVSEATALVLKAMPKFVYYSNYGNLDSEIYLPYVIKNMAREGIGAKETAKARTLKVLFEFVKLSPQEILDLGQEVKVAANQTLSTEQIDEMSINTRQRHILLMSASADLTQKFRKWWKRGNYIFRFQADGNHFRIWVSDEKRPDDIELEYRSAGLQWFLSFYLVFLVERSDAHADAILLLDEPGLSLHPHAQEDLSAFFDGLAETNQLLYTSHSPFLIDSDRLDRARKVFVGEDGETNVTADLNSTEGDNERRSAGYTVFAALGLTVAESFLIGCAPVIVEGQSDQHYLSGIKNLLIAAGKLKPSRELIFPPAGGTKGVKAVSSILGGRDEELPIALFDSDNAGKAIIKSLKDGIYAGGPELLLEVQTFTSMPDSEIEDLLPPDLIVREFDRWQRGADTPFGDEVKAGIPIVPQIETWAAKHKVVLQKPGWKVELAKRVKKKLLNDGLNSIPTPIVEQWTKLFEAFQTARSESAE
jgi:energy-coupling factor transporter ATP-binding protein EcfA2